MHRNAFRRSLLVSALLVAIPAFAQQDDLNYTLGDPNGRFWGGLQHDAKLLLVMGIRSGVSLGLSSVDQERNSNLITNKFTNGEFVSQMDVFFGDSSNARLTISSAYVYVVQKMNGAKQSELDAFVSGMRRRIRDAEATTK